MGNIEKIRAIDELTEHARQVRIIIDRLYGDKWETRYAARAILIRYILERELKQESIKDALLQLG